MKRHARSEAGFTLVELLVVILIIGILAAIAIPAFLTQKSKAIDASAKELARTGAQAAETYATDHNGEYAGLTTKALHEYEPGDSDRRGQQQRLSERGRSDGRDRIQQRL